MRDSINSPTQKERLEGLPTPVEVMEFLNKNRIGFFSREILMAYAIGDLVQATEAHDAYDQGFQDGTRAHHEPL